MIKAYYVMRRDLKMSPAKLAVQVGHGTQRLMREADYYELKDWENYSSSRKIVCGASSEKKLNSLYTAFKDTLTTVRIIDKGYTEFDGETLTGIAFFYDDTLENLFISNKIKRLQLYKESL